LRKTTTLKDGPIRYYFFPIGIPFFHRHWPRGFEVDAFINYRRYQTIVENIVQRIKPDVINLQGAENAYYSSSILRLHDQYPTIVSIQGYIGLEKNAGTYLALRKRTSCEARILTECRYFGGERDSQNYIRRFNRNFSFYTYYYPVNEALIEEINEKDPLPAFRYDGLFAGRVTKEKGVEDLIRLTGHLKKRNPGIRVAIAGPCAAGYKKTVLDLIRAFDCVANIDFLGFQNTQRELFEIVKASRMLFVPTYNDRLPSSIREALFLKTPVIAYRTGGIPMINEIDRHIIIVEQGDHEDMARQAQTLLDESSLRNALAEKGARFAKIEYGLSQNVQRMIEAYRDVIKRAPGTMGGILREGPEAVLRGRPDGDRGAAQAKRNAVLRDAFPSAVNIRPREME
jgi:glycosyltransferase involved in cell wall biosynthesis